MEGRKKVNEKSLGQRRIRGEWLERKEQWMKKVVEENGYQETHGCGGKLPYLLSPAVVTRLINLAASIDRRVHYGVSPFPPA